MTGAAPSAQVIAAAQGGEHWAFTELWTWLSGPVAGYVRARGVRDVDDVTSEVFLSVFTRMATFTGEAEQFRAFVFTVAHHRVVDEVRRTSRRPIEDPWDSLGDARRAPSAEDVAMERAGQSEAVALLCRLPTDQRDVLLLRILGDLSIEETAIILGKRPGAVKSLQHRGLNALRRKLSAQTVSPAARWAMTESR